MLFLLFCTVSTVAGGVTFVSLGLYEGFLSLMWLLPIGFAYFVLCLLLWALALILVSLTVDCSCDQPAIERQKFWRRILIETLMLLFTICRVRIKVTNLDLIPKDTRYLFTSNHLTNFDPLVALIALRNHDATFISKKENFDIPVIGKLMHLAGILSIDRENDRNAVRTVVQAAKLMKEDHTSVCLYPEGYTNRLPDTVLLPFREGSLKIAQKASVPVVVSVIHNVKSIRFPAVFFRLKTVVELEMLARIPAEEVCSLSTHDLSEKMWNIMYQRLTERK